MLCADPAGQDIAAEASLETAPAQFGIIVCEGRFDG
jgi:hypothetical protein